MREIEDIKFKAQTVESHHQKRENLEQILYQDAERRRKEQQKAKDHLDKVRDLPSTKPYHNSKSDKYVQQRFEREFKAVQEEFSQTNAKSKRRRMQVDSEGNVLLDFEDMMEVIKRLGFLPKDRAPEPHELALCNDLWTMVRGEDNQGVSYDTLRVVLLNIIGIKIREVDVRPPAPADNASTS